MDLIDDRIALKVLSKYHPLLDKTGYVKHSTTLRFLVYTFLLDFVNYTHSFFEEEQYDKVDRALRTLFTDGGCLMPYPVFCTNRVVLGLNEYMGTPKVRITEDLLGNDDRYTEDDRQRII